MVTFGIWPGVVDRDLVDLATPIAVPPEDITATTAALRELSDNASRFYVRCYRTYGPEGQVTAGPTPQQPAAYVGEGRLIDLVAGYGYEKADPEGFADSVRTAVREVTGLGGGKLQVCEEVNVGLPLDGGRPGCYQALAAGLEAALCERDASGADVLVGFNAAAALPEDPFWQAVGSQVAPDILARIDYLGLDFFPDVFRPIQSAELPGAVTYLVRYFRESATAIGIPTSVPIHITETGWPTGPAHPEQEQARVISTVAETVLDLANEIHLDTYTLFGLRDGLSSGPRMNRFGLLRDDHTAKPAFDTAKRLIANHGAGQSRCR